VIPTTCALFTRACEDDELLRVADALKRCARTDAGSEATPIIGQTENDQDGKPLKTTQKTNKVRSRS